MAVILLTACIQPKGMSYTSLHNSEERKKQYIDAIKFYLAKTSQYIVFVENSNTDISSLFKTDIYSGRLECLTYEGNKNKARGKGFGECEIIKYALENSITIHNKKNNRIIKITGRLIVKNIETLIKIHCWLLPQKSIICTINSDLSFLDSRCIIAPVDFYKIFLNRMNKIDDSTGYYFEHAFLDTIIFEKEYSYCPFYIQPNIVGISGTSGLIYECNNHNIIQKLRYIRYVLSLRSKFRKKYRTN